MSAVASDPRPKPVKVADAVRDRISAAKYPDGKLPTVRELSKEFGYAGQTVRDGLSILITEGRIFSAGNRGYFVAGDTQESLTRKPDVGEEIKEMRLQIQALAERVAALEAGANSDGV
ncbi:GntR family transcriptional regulator [Streptomyces lunaelactis]|uniref:GntR family transcriptional regulator n=1 Tax=Streptomyces lunaelactis TaxID=1535768 RepID=UPI001C2FE0C8|nr:GntR family transcriptional regulator [Streptomyces lunaelactis]